MRVIQCSRSLFLSFRFTPARHSSRDTLNAVWGGAGVVYWAPPESAMQRAAEALREPLVSAYGPCGGMPALVAALKEKLAAENGLTGVRRTLCCSQCIM